MNFSSTGGIFLREDNSGNLNVYDTSGNVLAAFIGGLFSSKMNLGVGVANSPIVTTTSTTPVSTGISTQVTPQIDTNLLVFASAVLSNNTGGDGGQIQIYIKAATENLAGGAALTGYSGSGSIAQMLSPAANNAYTVTAYALISGLTKGRAYTVTVGVNAITGGTLTLSVLGPSVIEI